MKLETLKEVIFGIKNSSWKKKNEKGCEDEVGVNEVLSFNNEGLNIRRLGWTFKVK